MDQTFTVINPYTNESLGEHAYHSLDECLEALNKVKSGQKAQRQLAAYQRAEALRKLGELLEANSEKMARLITAETGKTIADARVEMERAINTTMVSSDEARQISGEVLDSDAYAPGRDRMGVVCWRPLGTVLCITPFNFPINLAMHKIGPAFAAGNTILFKPGPQNIESGKLLTQLCHEAGIGEDMIQLVMPSLADINALISHPDVDAINFTGGTGAARSIADAAGYKKLLLELGGNDPLIVMDDGDIQAAVSAAINQRFATAGQRCTAAKRLFVHEAVYDDFKQLLVEESSKLKIGDPEDEDTFVGPLVSAQAADNVEAYIKAVQSEGAKTILGGQREGNIIHPTILVDIPETCELVKEEVFGPVIPIFKFTDLDAVIETINSTPFGLQAGVFTNDFRVMKRLFEELDVGTLATNDGPGFRAEHFPFGGVKQSGIGREGVKYAIKEMSFQKMLVL